MFEMIPERKSMYDPFAAFYKLGELGVKNYNIIKALVGRQKFEKKGGPQPGDGGPLADVRGDFRFVSFWKAATLPDNDGTVKVKFKAPSNLTRWRVLAVAVDKGGKMGLGQGTFLVNKLTEIRPALPNQVSQGDSLEARFSVFNRSEQERILSVSLSAAGPLTEPFSRELKLKFSPKERKEISGRLETNGSGRLSFGVRAYDTLGGDTFLTEIPVKEVYTTEVASQYGSTGDREISVPVSLPPEIIKEKSRVFVTLSPSLIGNLTRIFKYLRDYPYGCWEQKITKALSAALYLKFRDNIEPGFGWPGAQALVYDTLEQASSFQAPSGGMAYYQPKDGFTDPYLSAWTASAFAMLAELGYSPQPLVQDRLASYLTNLMQADSFPDWYTKEMKATFRASAVNALLKSGKVSALDVQRLGEAFPSMSLFGKALYLEALLISKSPAAVEGAVYDKIISAANETSGQVSFVEPVDIAFSRILESPLRTNCAVLSSLLTRRRFKGALAGSYPEKTAHFIKESMRKDGTFSNTQEDIFCLDALLRFSEAYENEKPDMVLEAKLNGLAFGKSRFKSKTASPSLVDTADFSSFAVPEGRISFSKEGTGRFYYSAGLEYAKEPGSTPENAGLEIRRKYSVRDGAGWREMPDSYNLKRGELVMVELLINAPGGRNFVVVTDPVPGALEPVNRNLATSSASDLALEQPVMEENGFIEYGFSRSSFYHKELQFDAVRFYSERLEPGTYRLSYIAQTVASGEFIIKPARAEEMYSPDVYGHSSVNRLSVE